MSANDALRMTRPYLSCVTGLKCATLRSMTQLTGSMVDTEFDRTTTLRPLADHRGEFLVDLDAGWSSLVGVHGGYRCALAVRAAIDGTGPPDEDDVDELPSRRAEWARRR